MRNISQVVASLTLLATQAHVSLASIAAPITASAASGSAYEVSLDTTTASAVVVALPARPDYNQQVLDPLHAAQAAKAAQAAAQAKAAAARKKVVTTVTTTVARVQAAATAETMQALRFCEAGNIYTRNSGNGYYGAYQFDLQTWGNWEGYARPDLAPADVQDAKFLATFSRRGWSPWPACSRKLGFM